jgi:hypothetical protein
LGCRLIGGSDRILSEQRVDFADSTLPRKMLSPTLVVYRNLLSNQGLLWRVSH